MSKHIYSSSQELLSTSLQSKLNLKQHRLKSFETLPKITNFSTSASIQPSILRKLQKRKYQEEYQVDPYMAAEVVKKYLLPMFEKINIYNKNAIRRQLMGLNQGDIFDSRDSTAETTVYKELLLSEKLLKELEYSNLKLKQAEEQLKIFEQVKYELRTEIAQLKAINEHNELTIEMNKILLNQQ